MTIPAKSAARRRRGVTLVEILVVAAICAVLAGLLLPVLGMARAMARRTVCTSQLRQVGMAARMYVQDFEAYPLRLSSLWPAYLGDARLLVCPSDEAKGQHAGNERLEGNQYLPSGVSYDYVPRWYRAHQLGWWGIPPDYGEGKWQELTPLADCQWHWARTFRSDWWDNAPDARGWTLVLTAGGSVRKIRVEDPLEDFTPERYR